MLFVRPILADVFGIQGTDDPETVLISRFSTGTMLDGPWSYRLASLFLVTPTYSLILVTLGTLAGRKDFFLGQAMKIWGRFLPVRTPAPHLPD
jgi:hypothetical protein